jgi:hypothetical protein
VWGRRGLDAVFLGRLTLPASELPGTAVELRAVDEADGGGTVVLAPPDATIPFAWRSAQPLTHVRWQVLSSPPAATDVSLHPTDLLAAGSTPADGDGRSGTFSVDMTTLADGGPLGALGGIPSEDAVDQIGEEVGGVADAVDAIAPADAARAVVWVRVVPFVGDLPGSRSSNPVEVVPAPPEPEPIPESGVPYRADVDATMPPAANPALSSCVRILEEIPPAEFDPGPGFGSGSGFGGFGGVGGSVWDKPNPFLPYRYDGNGAAIYPFTVCPEDIRGTTGTGSDSDCSLDPTTWGDCVEDVVEFVEDLGELLVDGVNALVDLVEEVKGAIVDAVGGLVCPNEVAGPCRAVLMTGLNALITATTGLPPSLPNFDDLADLAKGEIVDVALEQVNLSEACDAVAGAATGKSCGEVVTALAEQDLCSLAPAGSEDDCDRLLTEAQQLCEGVTGESEGEAADECRAVTADAQELLEAGARAVIDEGYDALVQQTRRQASLAVIVRSGMPLSWPGRETIVVPEPLGSTQPVPVSVDLRRTGAPLPAGGCGPLTVRLSTAVPFAEGEPYLPETVPFPADGSMTVLLDQPNHLFVVPAEDRPERADPLGLGRTAGDAVRQAVGGDWKLLLDAGAQATVEVTGDCIDATSFEPAPVGPPAPKPEPGVSP